MKCSQRDIRVSQDSNGTNCGSSVKGWWGLLRHRFTTATLQNLTEVMPMKSNIHRKLFNPDYFGWHWYCDGARRRQKQSDKHLAKKAARRERKESIRGDANDVVDHS